MSSWGEILVEWCNCLQLNPKIKDIQELRESDFFKNVLSVLNKADLLGKIEGPFFQILTLLNETYHYAQIDNINCDSFIELPEDQFLIITSLLLHYTCIYDGREKFTLPLCQHLSKKSQLSIKDFLEKINKEVKYSDLEKLIVKERIYEYAETKPMPQPLTAVFRTPSLKRKINFDKDRTVTKLKTALELEQYEKADVEEELKLQMKKTQKLEKLLSKSNDEITALKSEIFKYKCQTPPQCSKKYDSDHKMRLMKKELENFEQYIENNEKEHEKLREEHLMYKTKIEEYEIEYAKLQSKYLAYEKQIYELTEKLNEKSTKVTYLETYCKELNEILEGFRQQKPESTESSFSEYVHQNKINSSFMNQDNLASAVIEIQLKEAQEQIDHLNSRVALEEEINKDSIKKSELLERELNHMQEKRSELENQLITEKQRYIQEIGQIKNERDDFCNGLRISEKRNVEISNRILVLQQALDHLNSEKCNQLEEIEKQCVKIQEMENIIAIFKIESEKTSSDLSSKNIQLETLMTRHEISQRKLEEYGNFENNIKHHVNELKAFHKNEYFEYNKLFSELKESIDLYDIKLLQSEKLRDKLLIVLDEKKASNLSMLIDLENLKDEISKITADWIEEKKQKESLLQKQSELEEQLMIEKERYTLEIEQIQNERNNFRNEVQISEQKNNEKSDKILLLQGAFDRLNSEIENQHVKNQGLENIITTLKTESEKTSSELNSKNIELEDMMSRHENLQRKLEKYGSFEKHMKRQVNELKAFHTNEFYEYTKLISKLKESIGLYDVKLTKSEELRDKLLIELDERKASNLSMLINLENLKDEISKITAYWIEEKKQRESLLQKQSEFKEQLMSEKERYTLEIEQIQNERNNFQDKVQISEQKNNEKSDKILLLQGALDHLNSEMSNKVEEIENQCVKNQELENIISALKKESEKVSSDLNSKNIELEDIMSRYEKLRRKLEKYASFENHMKHQVNELKTLHTKEFSEYIHLISNLKESIGLYDIKLTKSEEVRDKLLIELNEKKALNLSMLIDLENKKEEISKITSDWIEDMKQKQSLLEKKSEIVDQLMSEKERYTQEIEQIKNEKNDFCNEMRTCEKKNNEIYNQNLVLQETLNHLNSEKNIQHETVEIQDAKILELENIILKLKSESEVSRISLISNNVKLEEVMIKHENSLKLLEKYISFEQDMKQCVIDLKAFHKIEIYGLDEVMSNLKESLNTYTNKIAESEELREKLMIELDGKNKSNSTLLHDLNNYKEEINKINLVWSEDKKLSEIINKENKFLKDNFKDLTKTIGMFNNELKKIVKSLKERKYESKLMLDKMQMTYEEFNTSDLLKTPEKNCNANDISIEINILGEQISKLNAYIDIFSEKETFYLKELENLKEEQNISNNNNFDVIQNLKEQILDNEHQLSSQTENLLSLVGKYNQLQLENQENLNKIEKHEAEMNEAKKNHLDETALKELLISNLQEKINGLEEEICYLKEWHNVKTDELLEKLEILQTEKFKYIEEVERYKTKIISLEAQTVIFKEEISQIKHKTGITEEEYETNLANLQVQVVRNKLEITELRKKNEELSNDKQVLSTQVSELEKDFDQEIKSRKIAEDQIAENIKSNFHLKNENSSLLNELETLRELREKCNKYEQERTNTKFLEEKHVELSQKIDTLMKSNEIQKESYEIFKIYYRKSKEDVDKLLTQKNSLENLTNNLRTQIVSLNKYIGSDKSNKIIEKKEALDVISEDIIKQYNRYSKQINDIVQELLRHYEKNCDNIFASLEMKIEDCLEKYNIHELSDKLSDLTDRAVDILEQIKISQREFENSCKEDDNMQQKENILTTSKRINIDKLKEDDLKKKNVSLRQKITLLENTKSNLEKTVKKVREENKKLKENDNKELVYENDLHYQMLLQEYISYKEDQENVLKDYKIRLEDLQKEYEDHKDNCMRTSTPIGNIFSSKLESDKNLEVELENLQVAFSNVRISNEKLENENMLLKRVVAEHREEMGKFTSIKEAYDKLLEENNKLMTEVDTMKYKRTRDRDEFLRWVKKERYENESKNTKTIQNIKAEYETKLEKMKDKMIKLYREEVNKEMSKIKGKQHASTSLLKTVEQLECDLFEAKQKIQLLMERDSKKENQDNNILSRMHGSNSQLHEFDTLSLKDFQLSCMNSTAIDFKPRPSVTKLMEFKHPSKVNPSSLDTRKQYDERQVKTLPRTGTVVEEVNIRRRTNFEVPNSIGNLQMEDEEEMFNNKYLTDLKQGNCELPAVEGRDMRVSELAWRNSLVPPHLKSSYPAETQFCSPERFREDDIKCGGNPFDDSQCKLLPNEKRKKDFGTTSYKKPGPPTPSKNGGRLSLTGSEMHAAKEQSESKKNTPGRIRSLFSGKSSSRNSIEPGASPKKRLSIFRR